MSPVPCTLHANHTAHHKQRTTYRTAFSSWFCALPTHTKRNVQLGRPQCGHKYDMVREPDSSFETMIPLRKNNILPHDVPEDLELACFIRHHLLDTSFLRAYHADRQTAICFQRRSCSAFRLAVHTRSGFVLLNRVQHLYTLATFVPSSPRTTPATLSLSNHSPAAGNALQQVATPLRSRCLVAYVSTHTLLDWMLVVRQVPLPNP